MQKDIASMTNGTDRQVAKAIASRGKAKLFRQLSLPEMVKMLDVSCELMGIPSEKIPGKEGMELIANFALAHYGHFTVEEIKTAFMLAAAGELEAEGHYQVFSAKYFGAVMNAYKVKGNAVAREIIDKPEPLPELEYKEADWTEAWEHIKGQAKTKNPKDLIIPEPIYDWLVKAGIHSWGLEARKELFKKARLSLIGELNYAVALQNTKPQDLHELQALKCEIKKGSDLYRKILNRAKIMAVQELLKNQAA